VSLGAGRAQMVGLVVGETLALGLTGSVLGAALAAALLGGFVRLAPPTFPRLAAITLDAGVLAVAMAIAVAAAVAAALVPAVHVLRGDVNASVRAGAGRGATAGRARALGRVLVAAEIALALALVTTAGVLVKSLLRLQATDLGVTRAPVLTFAVGLPPFVADGNAAVRRFHDEFLRRVRAVPGVTHASAINMLPIANTGNNGPVRRVDQTGERDGVPVTEVRVVADGYAEAMGLHLLAGRGIDERDGPQSAPVAVVNRTLAARLWPGVAPVDVVGQRLQVEYFGDAPPREIVGVVADVRSRRPDAPSDPEVHAPFRQVPFAGLSYVVRSEGDPTRLTGAIRSELAQMTPHVALGAVRTFDDIVETATRTSGLLSWLSVLFGGLALTLAAVGIYGLLSYSVAQRERELAVRAAVGATRGALMGLVLGEGARLTVVGLAAGLALAWAASSAVAGLLYEVSATDTAVFLAAPVALAVVAFLGYAVPAIRASRVEPVASLRAE
jgi:putative ABC transport system permease protein